MSENVSLFLRADVGGFGFGDSSDFSYQAMPGVHWRLGDHWRLYGAYRVMGFSRKNVRNAVLHGPLLGVGYRF